MRPLPGYPNPIGQKVDSVFPHAGPSSYSQASSGSAPALSTGGDTVYAVEAGLKLIDHCTGGVSDSGTYRVEVLYDSVSGIAGSSNPSAGQPKTTVRLRWYVVATGAQVAGAVNLSAEIVRLRAVGLY